MNRHAMIASGSKRAVNRAVVPVISALLARVAGYPLQALAQAFPVKPIRVIVPFAAGGNLDIVMRSLGQKLNEQMGQQIIIDNRIGASGSLGTDVVAKAAPDGYTLLATSNTFVATPAVVKTTTYDPVRDFAGISVFAWIPQLPAIGESALPGYEAIVFNAMLAPAGTPRTILDRLHAEISKAVQQADLRNRFIEQGVELTSSASPDECSAFIRQETAKYAKIIREAGIRGD